MIKLATAGDIKRLEVDTSHFKGNYPDTCSLEAYDAKDRIVDESTIQSLPWKEILPRTKLQAHTRHFYEEEIKKTGAVTHVRFNIYPDGGVSRLRIYGTIKGRED